MYSTSIYLYVVNGLRVSKEFIIRKIMDEYVIVPTGTKAEIFNGIITTNITGAFLWNILLKGSNHEELIKSLTDEFDVTEKEAAEDVSLFIETLKQYNILED